MQRRVVIERYDGLWNRYKWKVYEWRYRWHPFFDEGEERGWFLASDLDSADGLELAEGHERTLAGAEFEAARVIASNLRREIRKQIEKESMGLRLVTDVVIGEDE